MRDLSLESKHPRSNWPYASVLAVAWAVSVAGQTATSITNPPSSSATFDVASIKPSNNCTGFYMSPNGSSYFSVKSASVLLLIGMAYRLGDDQIAKQPNWIETDCYDVLARASGTGPVSSKNLSMMLRSLLEQRFGLQVHREQMEVRGYALVVAKGGPHLIPTKGEVGAQHIGQDGLIIHNGTMGTVAAMLPHVVGSHVVDETGLSGKYDIDLSFLPNASLATTDSSLPTVFTALKEQLGLQLVPQRIPITILKIDHINRSPTSD